MRVVLTEGCDNTWVRSLSPWQLAELAALFRQGKHLPDGTNHDSDCRWQQAGCKTRDSFGNWHRRRRSDGHERIVINRTDYGYEKIGVRRTRVWLIDPDTGHTEPIEGWAIEWVWYVSHSSSANYPPHRPPRRRHDSSDGAGTHLRAA